MTQKTATTTVLLLQMMMMMMMIQGLHNSLITTYQFIWPLNQNIVTYLQNITEFVTIFRNIISVQNSNIIYGPLCLICILSCDLGHKIRL
jgi:hypothetical protein